MLCALKAPFLRMYQRIQNSEFRIAVTSRVAGRAYQNRADYQSAQARVRAAEASIKAAKAARLPSLGITANYGLNGPTPNQSHGSYTLAVGLRIPIYEGGRTQVNVREAESVLRQQQAEAEGLRARIYYEVQSAFLNLRTADERVRVSSSTTILAQEQQNQAQDRFSAGVASNTELVQAQDALSEATETYIASLYAHNNAKARLAQALGAAGSSFIQFVRGSR